MKTLYNEDYYENGEELGVSGYTNYRWLPSITLPFAQKIIEYCEMTKDQHILDFGCAKGFMVKAFRELGYYNTFGTDISDYALQNADPSVKGFCFHKKNMDKMGYDWIMAKDVLEHITYDKIEEEINFLSENSNNIFVIVPLGHNGKYVVPEYEQDITHHIREGLAWWSIQFERAGFRTIKADYIVKGMKDNWSHYEKGNGFFIFKKR